MSGPVILDLQSHICADGAEDTLGITFRNKRCLLSSAVRGCGRAQQGRVTLAVAFKAPFALRRHAVGYINPFALASRIVSGRRVLTFTVALLVLAITLILTLTQAFGAVMF